jgi:hypothetical protein
MKNGQYDHEYNDEMSRIPPNRKPIPKSEHLLGCNVHHQGEIGKYHNFQEDILYSKTTLNATYSNA